MFPDSAMVEAQAIVEVGDQVKDATVQAETQKDTNSSTADHEKRLKNLTLRWTIIGEVLLVLVMLTERLATIRIQQHKIQRTKEETILT